VNRNELIKALEAWSNTHPGRTTSLWINKWIINARLLLHKAAAALREPADGWLPIESAPKNKTVLGVVDGETRLIRWCKTSHAPIYGWNIADQGVEDFELCHPTVWRYRPPPPKAAPSGDEG
jgi:hypothetical protein